jgi:predicted dehydrogenase
VTGPAAQDSTPTPGDRRIGLAFIGCGWATRLHSRTLARFSRDVRTYYASRDCVRAAEYAARFRGAGAFESYGAAIASPLVHVVLIATPPSTHLALTLDALAAGKDVIVEKPPFLSTADLDTARDAASRIGRFVMVAENYFYKPLAERLRGLLASGDLGDVRFLLVNALKLQATGGWRDDPALSGGGAMFESGVHWVNFMGNLGLRVVSAEAIRAGPRSGPDRSSLAVFRYEGGAVGALAQSWEIPSVLKGVRLSRIFGTAGSVTFESNGAFVVERGRRVRIHLPGFRDMLGYRAMFRDFLGTVRDRMEPRFTLALARRDMELLEAMRAGLGG